MHDSFIHIGESLSPYSITQSVIGDCSFLASLCTAANYEKRYINTGISFFCILFNAGTCRFPAKQRRLIGAQIYPQDSSGLPIYNPSGKYLMRVFWYSYVIYIFLYIYIHISLPDFLTLSFNI